MRGVPVQVLLVEDNNADISLIMEAFKSAKALNNLSVVRDGMEAMEFLRHQDKYTSAPRPDLILLDLNLPRKDGHQVLAEIKSDPDLRRIPVIVLAGSDADKDVIDAYDLYANCYIVKPLDFTKLTAIAAAIEAFWLSIAVLPTQV